MPVIEQLMKKQYARFFEKQDWKGFKSVAEYYLGTATKLRKRDIECKKAYRLLIRNVQKRLFIGIGCELLVKTFYLKSGYCINRPRPRRVINASFPYRIVDINQADFLPDSTYSMNFLIDHLGNVHQFQDHARVVKGFKIAKVFRNKEAHVVAYRHQFDPTNYSDIESALIVFYPEAFSESINIQFSVERNEEARFSTSSLR